jgi:hypothetical protein
MVQVPLQRLKVLDNQRLTTFYEFENDFKNMNKHYKNIHKHVRRDTYRLYIKRSLPMILEA